MRKTAVRRAILAGGVAIMVAGAAGAEGDAAQGYKGYETPAYTVEARLAGAEIRQYASRLVAEVTVPGSRSGAAGRGFRALAGYIFGGNAGGAKIAMTTPVVQVPASAASEQTVSAAGPGQWLVQFTMPGDWRLDSLPAPRDPAVRLREVPGSRQIVLAFSGLPTEAALSDAEGRLRTIAAETGQKLGAGPTYLFYDSPFTLPWNRRTEVAFVALP